MEKPPMRPPIPVRPPMPPKPPARPPMPVQPQPQPPTYYMPQIPCIPCDHKLLHHMYMHMKMCHRYEKEMMKHLMRLCKRQMRRYPYGSSSMCTESSSRWRESSCDRESSCYC